MENKEPKNKIVIVVVILLIVTLLIGIFAFFVYTNRAGKVGESIKAYLPFGSGGETRVGGGELTPEPGGGTIEGSGNQQNSILKKLHDSPVAGIFPFVRNSNDGQVGLDTNIIVRYIERGLGHIFETNMSSGIETRISNESRYKIYEALWGNNGNSVAIRYLGEKEDEEIRTFSITLSDIKNSEDIDEGRLVDSLGEFLPQNISEVVVSEEKGDRMFYIHTTGDSSVGATISFLADKQTQIFSSPLKEWLPQWPKNSLITMTTKPSATVDGLMFFLDPTTSKLTKILSGIPGLTTNTNPAGNKILYSASSRNGFGLFLYDVVKDEHKDLSLSTLPEKCVWGKNNVSKIYCGVPEQIPPEEYPDSWYKGLVTFNDGVWMIDVESGITVLLANPKEISGADIDAIKLALDPIDSYLFFVNKKDSTPWSLKLSSENEVSS